MPSIHDAESSFAVQVSAAPVYAKDEIAARTIENPNNEHFSAPLQKHHTAIEAFRTLPCGIKIEGSSHAVAAAPTVMEAFLERTVRQSNTSVKGAHRWQSASSTSAS